MRVDFLGANMREISIKQLDDIADVRRFLMFLCVSFQSWNLSLDELDNEHLKEAFSQIHLMLYDEIKKLEI